MSIQVVACKTKIKTVIGDVKAIVTAICIRDENICYEISYFHNGIQVAAGVKRYEFEIDSTEKRKAGLVNYDQPEDESGYTKLIEH
jgi:hypothetical protein